MEAFPHNKVIPPEAFAAPAPQDELLEVWLMRRFPKSWWMDQELEGLPESAGDCPSHLLLTL